MTPFQFIVIASLVVIALLLGTLVGCASVLIARIRNANSVMRRIEEALVSRTGVFASPNTRAPAAVQVPETSIKNSDEARLLTIRDLKIRPEHRNGRAGSRNGPEVSRERLDAPLNDLRAKVCSWKLRRARVNRARMMN